MYIRKRSIFVPDFMCEMHVTDITGFYICEKIVLTNMKKHSGSIPRNACRQ